MPIQIACAECGKRYRFPDERAGSTVECKDCGAEIDIPGEGRRKAKSRDDADIASRPRSRKKGRTSKSSGAPIGLILAGGVGALVVVAVLAFVLFRRPAGNNAASVAGNPVTPTPGVPNTAASNSTAAATAEKKSTVATKDWKAKVDPPTTPPPSDPVAAFNIDTKSANQRPDYLLYPDIASPYVLLGDPSPSSKKSRELWNLVSGTKVRDVPPAKNMHKSGLSTDGKYFAWYRYEDNGGLDVMDTEAGKIVATIPLPSQQINVTTVTIPSSQRLLIASTVHRKLMSWKLPSGEPERTIQLGENAQPNEQFAISPGGRYAAFTADYLSQALQIYDLDTGEPAGVIEFAERMPHKALRGLAFSPDGTELAAIFGQNHSATSDRVLIWNAATGSNVADFSLPDPDQRPVDTVGAAPSLQWFPDRKRLLQDGRHIIDREAKKVVYSLPPPLIRFDTKKVRHVLSNTTIASWDGAKGSEALTALELKESDIARARDVAAGGGMIIDARLPKLTTIDRKKASDKSMISGGWKVQPDPAAESPKFAASITLSDATGRPRELQFSRGSAIAALRFATGEDESKALTSGIYRRVVQVTGDNRNRRRYDIEPVMCRQNWLELINLKDGKSSGKVDIGFPCELVTVSPGGSRALVTPMDGQGRLDVFSIPDGAHVAGCRPFGNEEKAEHRDIEAAAFLDDNTIAACSRNDQLIVYKVPDCEPLYSVQDAGILAISPGGKLLATCAEKRIEFRNSITGDGLGSVEIGGQAVALSFSPKGDRLAVVVSVGNVSKLTVIELKDGSVASLSIPVALGPIIWNGEQQLLVGAEKASQLIHRNSKPSTLDRHLMLVDLRRQAVLWSYEYGTGDVITFGRATTDNQLWVAGAAKKGGGLKLTALSLPEPTIAGRLDDKSLDAKLAVKPGMSVSLQFNLSDPPEAAGVAQQVRDAVESAARTNGLTIKDGQPLKLTVSAVVGNEPGTMEMQLFGVAGGNQPSKVSVQPKALTIRMAYELNGQPIWEAQRKISNGSAALVQIGNKQPQQAIDEQMWRLSPEAFREIQPASHIFSGATEKGLGSSRLFGDGAFPPD